MKYLLSLICCAGLLATGCGQSGAPTQTGDGSSATENATPVSNTITLCKDCGQEKGTDACCAEDAEQCECGFAHGSPACCKLKKTGEDITLCAACGNVAGEGCCDDGKEVCDCGFHKGSAACCKVKKDEATDETKDE